jgi:hypothetical protein
MEVSTLTIFCREDNDCMDLDALDGAVCARAEAWRENGVQWRIRRGPATPKPAANLSVERASAMADLTLWVSGKAELGWSPDADTEPVWRHYEISSALELNACLDDLQAHLGLVSRLIRSRWPSGIRQSRSCGQEQLQRSLRIAGVVAVGNCDVDVAVQTQQADGQIAQ